MLSETSLSAPSMVAQVSNKALEMVWPNSAAGELDEIVCIFAMAKIKLLKWFGRLRAAFQSIVGKFGCLYFQTNVVVCGVQRY